MRPNTAANIIFTLVVLCVLAMVGESIYTVRTTGTLQVTTTDPSAILAISAANKGAEYIGQGNANVRLSPGTYDVSATDQGTTIAATVQVTKQEKTTQALAISDRVKQAEQDNKLFAQLPLLGPAFSYTINYYLAYNNGQTSPVITIDASSPQATQAAQNWLEYNGYNLSDFDIQYTTTQIMPSDANNYVGSTQP